jgi:hypothetical protein
LLKNETLLNKTKKEPTEISNLIDGNIAEPINVAA